ncbi:MAG: adenylate/guanylate cyclase domain-containing protein [Lachnospiraceae bacterium]|nr:adenylate/guanylate cyclase domain-containing protein [Lachnospiraceae bacterium]
MSKNLKHNLLISLVCSVLLTVLVIVGVLSRLDRWMQDAFFEQPGFSAGDIVVIGIDDEALERIGPYNTWDRSVMARALDALAADPDNLPAVVAVDTLYESPSDNPEADAALVAAADKLGCVVTATVASYGSKIMEKEDGSFRLDNYAVTMYAEPFKELREVTTQGHINAMYDTDGIMRHALLYTEPEGGRVYSMAYTAADMYLQKIEGRKAPTPPLDSKGRFFVPFTAAPGGYYDHVSVADLVDGTVSSSYYADKIVLIGPYATGLQDEYFTPVARAEKMYGVEFQANVIEAVIKGDFKVEMADWIQLIILFAVTFGVTFLCLSLKVRLAVIISACTAGLSLLCCIGLYKLGYITHPLWIPVGVAVGCIVSVAVHYIKAAFERAEITRTFSRYVAPEIVSEILKEGTENIGLGGKTCDIAVLFVDVRGFTTMSERLDPEKVVFILNKYLTMASGCVEKNHGTLDKFVGDAMMAFWGAPLPQENAVYNAVRTAMDIVEGAHRVSEELKAEIGEVLNVGVGVNYGPAVVGNMGSEKHMDYTAIGDTVNTAARLEANAPGGTVYISRAVADVLGDKVTFTSLGGTIKLKGKAEGFEVLKVETLE